MMRRLIAGVLPTPRQPVRWSSLWPLVAIGALLAIALPVFIVTHRLSLSSPWALLWLVAMVWIWYLHAAGWGGLGRLRGQVALLVRLAIIALVVVALSGPRAVRISDQLTVLYVLDCSDSIGERVIDASTDWIANTAAGKPAHDAAGLVVFGHDAAVEIPPRQAFTYDAISSRLARDGTNIENALSLASAVLPGDAPGRIVLISDGTATEGDTERMVDQLAARGVPIDVLPVSYEHSEEVWLERLELPQEVHVRQSYQAAIILGSLAPGHGTLVLTENGHEVVRQPVDYPAGSSRFTVPLYLREAGYYEYAATIIPEPGHDTWLQNNTVLGAISLRGSGHVLLVRDATSTDRDWQSLAQALRESGRSVEVMDAAELPGDPLALESCDAIAMVDVPADAVSQNQQLAIRDAVQDQGVGLVMVGGPNSFGPGGWNHTPVEEALPVTMDVTQRKVLPKGALAIIIEMCEFPDGDGWAKLITKKAMQVLSARDDVGVLTFSWDNNLGDHWIFPLTPAKEYDRLAPLLDGAELGDMPSFQTILTVALKGLQADDAAAKHLLLISDGDCAPPEPALLKQFADAGIPISTVLIVPDSDEAKSLMQQIAQVTRGRSYYPSSPQSLPAIFIKEAKTMKRSEIQNVDFTPRVTFPSPILKGLESLPGLKGYILTTAKPHALTVLAGPDREEDDPVLATWRFGVGSAAAWTSDLNGNWAKDWQTWSHYRAFIDQLFTHVARTQEDSTISLALDASGGVGSLSVEDHGQTSDFLTVSARVQSASGEETTLDVPQIAPGRYAASFPLSGIGRYHVGVSAIGGDGKRTEHAVSTLNVSYSAEYLRFRANPLVLQGIAHRTGGRVLTGHEDGSVLYPADRPGREHTRSIADLVLAAAALLLPADIAIRRVSIDWLALVARMAWWRRRRSDSPATLGALLARKATISMPRAQGPLPPPIPSAATRRPPSAPPAPSTPPAAPPPAAAPPPTAGGTTGQLLEARRRRQNAPKPPP